MHPSIRKKTIFLVSVLQVRGRILALRKSINFILKEERGKIRQKEKNPKYLSGPLINGGNLGLYAN